MSWQAVDAFKRQIPLLDYLQARIGSPLGGSPAVGSWDCAPCTSIINLVFWSIPIRTCSPAMGVGSAETSFASPSCITECDSEGQWRCCAAAPVLDLCSKT